ncbi:MAG: GNAT family N-acetyltransferase [bacterium]|nr:GNAT family N-acetyltransferase [bacterium]
MSRYHGPTLLSADHDADDFDCGDETLDHWLKHLARRNQREGSSRTWVVADGARVVAYYASSAAVLARAAATGRAGRNQPDPLPAMLLGRLAVDREHQGRGLGAALLKHFLLKVVEVATHTGVRVALVHAANNAAAGFYRRYGFEPSPIDDLTLMLLVKDIAI